MFDLATFNKLSLRPGDRVRIHAHDDKVFTASIVRKAHHEFEIMNPRFISPPWTYNFTLDMVKSIEVIARAPSAVKRGSGHLLTMGQELRLRPYEGQTLSGIVVAAMHGYAIVKPDRSVLPRGFYYKPALRFCTDDAIERSPALQSL